MVVELAEKSFSDALGEVASRLGERQIVCATPRGHVFVSGAEEGVGEGIKFAGVDGVNEMLIDEIIHHAGRGFAVVDGAEVVVGVFSDDRKASAQFFPGRDNGPCHKLGEIFP